uniref:BTB/POZ domain-containing protein 2 n=1 Tax=Ascaris suum TaxID=6253 RepID=F1KV02_ASCSU
MIELYCTDRYFVTLCSSLRHPLGKEIFSEIVSELVSTGCSIHSALFYIKMWQGKCPEGNREPEGAAFEPSTNISTSQTASSSSMRHSTVAYNMRGVRSFNGSDGDMSHSSTEAGEQPFGRQVPGREGVHYVLGNMRTANGNFPETAAHSEDDPDDGDGESEERENGYPLVADLSHLRIQNHAMRSVDEVIEQQAFNQEVIDDLNLEQRNAYPANVANDEGDGRAEEEEINVVGGSLKNGSAAGGNHRHNELQQHSVMSASVADRLAAITSGSVAPSFVFSDDEAAEVMMASSTSEQGEASLGLDDAFRANLPANILSDAGASAETPSEGKSTSRRPARYRTHALGQDQQGSSQVAKSSQPQQYPLHNAAAVGRSVNDASMSGADSSNLWESLSSRGSSASVLPSMGWQATKSTLKERFSFMYCNEILADVYFVVGRGDQRQRLPAHKFVLATGSAVFDAMFNGGLSRNPKELSNAASVPEIELPDVEPNAFLALLKFLYSDDVSIGPESVMTTLYTAKKYAVPAMENACVDFLKRNLAADNAFMLLTQARLFDEPQLASLCLEIIDKNTIEALNAEGFTEIDLETLCAVLKRDTLRVREAPLFMAVMRWSAEECRRRALPVNPENQRRVLGKALHMVRFPLMTIDEFAQYAAQSGILLDRELVSLFLYFTVNPKPQIGFVDVPRCCVFGKEVVVSRFQRVEGRWGYSGTPDRIKFTVDRKIYVIGFGLHGSIHGPHEYQVTIQILHCGTGKVLANNDTSFSCDGSSGTFRVLFKEPVEITPCVTYIASACLKGPDSHYGTKGLRRIVHQSPSSGVVTFQFTYAAGNNNGTSVEDGQIPEIIFCTKIS